MKRRTLTALAQVRRLCRWTQADLADACGVSLAMIKKLESRSKVPGARRSLPNEMAMQIALLTGVSPTALAKGELQTLGRKEVTQDSIEEWWAKWTDRWQSERLHIPAFQRRIDALLHAAEVKQDNQKLAGKLEIGEDGVSPRELLPLLRLFSIFDHAFQQAVQVLDLGPEMAAEEEQRASGKNHAKIKRKATPFVRLKTFPGGQEAFLVGARVTDRTAKVENAWKTGNWSFADEQVK